MSTLPAKELLEKTHKFPGPFIFKAIGKVEDNFLPRLVAAVREELQMDIDPHYQSRDSGSGLHVAVTVEVRVQSADQVLAVYARMAKVKGLVISL